MISDPHRFPSPLQKIDDVRNLVSDGVTCSTLDPARSARVVSVRRFEISIPNDFGISINFQSGPKNLEVLRRSTKDKKRNMSELTVTVDLFLSRFLA